jgi:hypothetical protein
VVAGNSSWMSSDQGAGPDAVGGTCRTRPEALCAQSKGRRGLARKAKEVKGVRRPRWTKKRAGAAKIAGEGTVSGHPSVATANSVPPEDAPTKPDGENGCGDVADPL